MKRKLNLLLMLLLAWPMVMLAAGTTWQTATEITSGKSVTGSLSESVTEQWYKIVVTENGEVTIMVGAGSGLGLRYTTLYALADGELHERGYVYGGSESDPAVLTVKDCAKGTYYIMVPRNGGQGAYTMNCSFTPMSATYANDSEPNDTYQQAKLMAVNASVVGHLGYVYYEDRDGVDWYKVNVTENGTLTITMTPHGELGIRYTTLYALADGELHERGHVYGGSESDPAVLTVKDCAKGTYYIMVPHNVGQGAYTLKCNFTPKSATFANDKETNDTWQTAQYLNRGSKTTGQLGYVYYDDTDKADWYKINVPRDGRITLTFEAEEGLGLRYTTLYTLDADNKLHERSYKYGNGEIVVDDAAVGNYYVMVPHNSGEGGYTLQYKFEQNPYATDQEPNNDKASALTLAKGATVAGHLGYVYYDDTDKEDWYKLSLALAGSITVTYQAQDGLGFNYVELWDSNDSERGYKYGQDENGNNTLTVERLDAGTYYLRVRHNGGQGYYLLTYGTTLGTVEKQAPLADEGDEDDKVTVTVGSALMVGFSSNYALDFTSLASKGVSAWTATGFKNNSVILSRVYQVPAGEGIMVRADKAGTYTVDKTTQEAFYMNMFVGTPDGAEVDMYENFWGETYLTLTFALSSTTKKPGFFPNTGKKTYGKGKMYLHMPARLLPEYAKTRISDFLLDIEFEDDEVTGISDAEHLNDNVQMTNDRRGEVYNLNGQRIAQPRRGQLYIQNGRKVLMK